MARPDVDIDKLLEKLLANPRLREGRAFSGAKTYGDEPIIRRGSQMTSYRPGEIAQMRDLQRTPAGRTWSETRLFFEQARLMEDYEDHVPFDVQFVSYYPTYRSMSDAQLRAYFSWRTQVRRGNVQKASTSFAYVYVYELLMSIGCAPGEKGFRAIEGFYLQYREYDQSIDRNLRAWLVDYAVEHGLPPELAAPYANAEHDAAVAVLVGVQAAALTSAPHKGSRRVPLDFGPAAAAQAASLIDAVEKLSSYRPSTSRLYREQPDDFAQVLQAVFVRLARHYGRSRSEGLVETLFGSRFSLRHPLYASAVHYEPKPHPDCIYQLSETRRFICKNGAWICDGFHDGGQRSAKLGDIVRAVDRQLRAAIDYAHPLKEHAEPKYLVKMIDAEAADYLAYKAAHAPRHVDIDLSKLGSIRTAAAATCESLLIDEEREDVAGEDCPEAEGLSLSSNSPVRTETPPAPPAHAELRAQTSPPPLGVSQPYDLTSEESQLLQALLAGNQPQVAGSVDLLVDSINEKLFDLLGDTALEFGDDGAPQVVEDYVDDLRDAHV